MLPECDREWMMESPLLPERAEGREEFDPVMSRREAAADPVDRDGPMCERIECNEPCSETKSG